MLVMTAFLMILICFDIFILYILTVELISVFKSDKVLRKKVFDYRVGLVVALLFSVVLVFRFFDMLLSKVS